MRSRKRLRGALDDVGSPPKRGRRIAVPSFHLAVWFGICRSIDSLGNDGFLSFPTRADIPPATKTRPYLPPNSRQRV